MPPNDSVTLLASRGVDVLALAAAIGAAEEKLKARRRAKRDEGSLADELALLAAIRGPRTLRALKLTTEQLNRYRRNWTAAYSSARRPIYDAALTTLETVTHVKVPRRKNSSRGLADRNP